MNTVLCTHVEEWKDGSGSKRDLYICSEILIWNDGNIEVVVEESHKYSCKCSGGMMERWKW